MPKKKILIAILLVAVITVAILVPVLILIRGPSADKTPPTIEIQSPINSTYTIQAIPINFTTTDSDVQAIWYRIHNDTAGSWVDATNISWTTPILRSLTQDGTYTLFVWARDTAGNTANAVNVTFIVNALPPQLTIVSPTNTTYFSQNTQVTINLSSPDTDTDTFWYQIYNETGSRWVDPTNITWTSSCLRTLTNGGIYTLYAWVNDTMGRISSMKSVTFTVYEQIIYSGDHAFSLDLMVGIYQQVVFQNGAFSFTSGSIFVLGILAMYNVTWTSDLKINGSSAVIYGINITFLILDMYGTLDTSLSDVNFFVLDLFDNLHCTLTDAFFSGSPSVLNNAVLNVTDSTINGGATVANSGKLIATQSGFASVTTGYYAEANLSYCDIGGVYEYDWSSLTLTTCDVDSAFLMGNESLSLINSSVNTLYEYLYFYTGNFNINYNIISGTGTYIEPKVTFTNSTIAGINADLSISDSTNVSFNNSAYYIVRTFNSANITLYNTTVFNINMADDSKGTIINSTILSTLDLQNNGTIYLANVTVNEIVHGFNFYKGDISGYNATFVGAESWRFPKITLGPNVDYSNYWYMYQIRNQANFTLVNTSQVKYIYAWDSSNASLFSCNMPFAQLYCYNYANITAYFSDLYHLAGYNYGNYTLINTTCYSMALQQFAFARVVNSSHILTLNLYDFAWYYKSPESVIDTIYDW